MDSQRSATPRRRSRRRWSLVAFIAVLGVIVAACSTDLPQNSLDPAGPVAREIDSLFRVVLYIAIAIFVLVEGAIIYAVVRYRRRKGRENPVQVHGNTRLEVLWTVIPAVLLLGVAIPTVATVFSLSREPEGAVEIRVIGHQWWWEFEYPGEGVITANEMHIPAGVPVHLTLESQETPGGLAGFTEDGQPIQENAIAVIHSFWVPRLAGKQDLIPGRIESMTIEADEPGVFPGQCTEYCGLSHANMRLRVVAETQADFQRWLSEQRAPATAPEPGSAAAEGAEAFLNFGTGSCIMCHAVKGIEGATARVGPDLTHFGSRQTLAAGLLEMTPENIARWLDDPRSVKPGVVMPDYNLTEDQIAALVEYLQSLE